MKPQQCPRRNAPPSPPSSYNVGPPHFPPNGYKFPLPAMRHPTLFPRGLFPPSLFHPDSRFSIPPLLALNTVHHGGRLPNRLAGYMPPFQHTVRPYQPHDHPKSQGRNPNQAPSYANISSNRPMMPSHAEKRNYKNSQPASRSPVSEYPRSRSPVCSSSSYSQPSRSPVESSSVLAEKESSKSETRKDLSYERPGSSGHISPVSDAPSVSASSTEAIPSSAASSIAETTMATVALTSGEEQSVIANMQCADKSVMADPPPEPLSLVRSASHSSTDDMSPSTSTPEPILPPSKPYRNVIKISGLGSVGSKIPGAGFSQILPLKKRICTAFAMEQDTAIFPFRAPLSMNSVDGKHLHVLADSITASEERTTVMGLPTNLSRFVLESPMPDVSKKHGSKAAAKVHMASRKRKARSHRDKSAPVIKKHRGDVSKAKAARAKRKTVSPSISSSSRQTRSQTRRTSETNNPHAMLAQNGGQDDASTNEKDVVVESSPSRSTSKSKANASLDAKSEEKCSKKDSEDSSTDEKSAASKAGKPATSKSPSKKDAKPCAKLAKVVEKSVKTLTKGSKRTAKVKCNSANGKEESSSSKTNISKSNLYKKQKCSKLPSKSLQHSRHKPVIKEYKSTKKKRRAGVNSRTQAQTASTKTNSSRAEGLRGSVIVKKNSSVRVNHVSCTDVPKSLIQNVSAVLEEPSDQHNIEVALSSKVEGDVTSDKADDQGTHNSCHKSMVLVDDLSPVIKSLLSRPSQGIRGLADPVLMSELSLKIPDMFAPKVAKLTEQSSALPLHCVADGDVAEGEVAKTSQTSAKDGRLASPKSSCLKGGQNESGSIQASSLPIKDVSVKICRLSPEALSEKKTARASVVEKHACPISSQVLSPCKNDDKKADSEKPQTDCLLGDVSDGKTSSNKAENSQHDSGDHLKTLPSQTQKGYFLRKSEDESGVRAEDTGSVAQADRGSDNTKRCDVVMKQVDESAGCEPKNSDAAESTHECLTDKHSCSGSALEQSTLKQQLDSDDDVLDLSDRPLVIDIPAEDDLNEKASPSDHLLQLESSSSDPSRSHSVNKPTKCPHKRSRKTHRKTTRKCRKKAELVMNEETSHDFIAFDTPSELEKESTDNGKDSGIESAGIPEQLKESPHDTSDSGYKQKDNGSANTGIQKVVTTTVAPVQSTASRPKPKTKSRFKGIDDICASLISKKVDSQQLSEMKLSTPSIGRNHTDKVETLEPPLIKGINDSDVTCSQDKMDRTTSDTDRQHSVCDVPQDKIDLGSVTCADEHDSKTDHSAKQVLAETEGSVNHTAKESKSLVVTDVDKSSAAKVEDSHKQVCSVEGKTLKGLSECVSSVDPGRETPATKGICESAETDIKKPHTATDIPKTDKERSSKSICSPDVIPKDVSSLIRKAEKPSKTSETESNESLKVVSSSETKVDNSSKSLSAKIKLKRSSKHGGSLEKLTEAAHSFESKPEKLPVSVHSLDTVEKPSSKAIDSSETKVELSPKSTDFSENQVEQSSKSIDSSETKGECLSRSVDSSETKEEWLPRSVDSSETKPEESKACINSSDIEVEKASSEIISSERNSEKFIKSTISKKSSKGVSSSESKVEKALCSITSESTPKDTSYSERKSKKSSSRTSKKSSKLLGSKTKTDKSSKHLRSETKLRKSAKDIHSSDIEEPSVDVCSAETRTENSSENLSSAEISSEAMNSDNTAESSACVDSETKVEAQTKSLPKLIDSPEAKLEISVADSGSTETKDEVASKTQDSVSETFEASDAVNDLVDSPELSESEALVIDTSVAGSSSPAQGGKLHPDESYLVDSMNHDLGTGTGDLLDVEPSQKQKGGRAAKRKALANICREAKSSTDDTKGELTSRSPSPPPVKKKRGRPSHGKLVNCKKQTLIKCHLSEDNVLLKDASSSPPKQTPEVFIGDVSVVIPKQKITGKKKKRVKSSSDEKGKELSSPQVDRDSCSNCDDQSPKAEFGTDLTTEPKMKEKYNKIHQADLSSKPPCTTSECTTKKFFTSHSSRSKFSPPYTLLSSLVSPSSRVSLSPSYGLSIRKKVEPATKPSSLDIYDFDEEDEETKETKPTKEQAIPKFGKVNHPTLSSKVKITGKVKKSRKQKCQPKPVEPAENPVESYVMDVETYQPQCRFLRPRSRINYNENELDKSRCVSDETPPSTPSHSTQKTSVSLNKSTLSLKIKVPKMNIKDFSVPSGSEEESDDVSPCGTQLSSSSSLSSSTSSLSSSSSKSHKRHHRESTSSSHKMTVTSETISVTTNEVTHFGSDSDDVQPYTGPIIRAPNLSDLCTSKGKKKQDSQGHDASSVCQGCDNGTCSMVVTTQRVRFRLVKIGQGLWKTVSVTKDPSTGLSTEEPPADGTGDSKDDNEDDVDDDDDDDQPDDNDDDNDKMSVNSSDTNIPDLDEDFDQDVDHSECSSLSPPLLQRTPCASHSPPEALDSCKYSDISPCSSVGPCTPRDGHVSPSSCHHSPQSGRKPKLKFSLEQDDDASSLSGIGTSKERMSSPTAGSRGSSDPLPPGVSSCVKSRSRKSPRANCWSSPGRAQSSRASHSDHSKQDGVWHSSREDPRKHFTAEATQESDAAAGDRDGELPPPDLDLCAYDKSGSSSAEQHETKSVVEMTPKLKYLACVEDISDPESEDEKAKPEKFKPADVEMPVLFSEASKTGNNQFRSEPKMALGNKTDLEFAVPASPPRYEPENILEEAIQFDSEMSQSSCSTPSYPIVSPLTLSENKSAVKEANGKPVETDDMDFAESFLNGTRTLSSEIEEQIRKQQIELASEVNRLAQPLVTSVTPFAPDFQDMDYAYDLGLVPMTTTTNGAVYGALNPAEITNKKLADKDGPSEAGTKAKGTSQSEKKSSDNKRRAKSRSKKQAAASDKQVAPSVPARADNEMDKLLSQQSVGFELLEDFDEEPFSTGRAGTGELDDLFKSDVIDHMAGSQGMEFGFSQMDDGEMLSSDANAVLQCIDGIDEAKAVVHRAGGSTPRRMAQDDAARLTNQGSGHEASMATPAMGIHACDCGAQFSDQWSYQEHEVFCNGPQLFNCGL